jgi:hypothetical protein
VLPMISNIAYRVGRELKWDGKKEQFIGDREANKLLRRNDRKGFAIPNLGGTAAEIPPDRHRASARDAFETARSSLGGGRAVCFSRAGFSPLRAGRSARSLDLLPLT